MLCSNPKPNAFSLDSLLSVLLLQLSWTDPYISDKVVDIIHVYIHTYILTFLSYKYNNLEFIAVPNAEPLVVPQELPSILSLIYSNIPPIKKGTSSLNIFIT